MRVRRCVVRTKFVRGNDPVCVRDIPLPWYLLSQCRRETFSRFQSLELQQSGVDLASRLCRGLDTPFAGDNGQSSRSNVCFLCGEKYVCGQPRIVAKEVFGGVVGKKVGSEDGHGRIVEIGIRIGGRMDERAGQCLEWESWRQ